MITCSIEELLEFWALKSGDFSIAVRLDQLRALHAQTMALREWQAQAERLAAENAALRQTLMLVAHTKSEPVEIIHA